MAKKINKMTYELAKQLNDAGFLQDRIATSREGENISFVDSGLITREDHTKISRSEFEKKQNRCYIPTLSELIEACGDQLLNIEHVLDGGLDGKEKLWWASAKNHERGGETIEEAVANLWLALHTNGN